MISPLAALEAVWLFGISLVHTDYERLTANVSGMESKPRVILLYNPTPYELYRDILIDLNANYDQVAEF
jgi:hypothetical protein